MKNVILIIGKICSGKDTLGEYISKKYNVPVFTVSDGLRKIAKEMGLSTDRENLIKISNEIVLKHSSDFLVKKIISSTNANFIVIVGAKLLGQIEYLKNNTNSLVIGIEADDKIRFERVLKRNRKGDGFTYKDFLYKEHLENKNGGLEVEKCMEKCDYIIKNNQTLDDLINNFENILSENNIIKFNT